MADSLEWTVADCLRQRRQNLGDRFGGPVLLWSGGSLSRNFPANRYGFRASSHFLYFAGVSIEDAIILLEQGNLTLFMDDASPEDVLWHGEAPTRDQLAAQIGAIAAYPLSEFRVPPGAATIPVQDPQTRSQQVQRLERPLGNAHGLSGVDLNLAQVLVELRLQQDAEAIAGIQSAAAVAVQAHRAGMACTPNVQTEAEVRAAMEAVILSAGMTPAYTSIVTIQGQVLHNIHSHQRLEPGALLLADVGAEHPLGWASDITRTWPVSGKWSPTQRAIYDIVLAAHDDCIESILPGVEYRDIHRLAAKIILEGLVDLKILNGNPSDLIQRDVQALFFPHGVGHTLGLDVHDMEDLGDMAGYAPGRQRSDRPGLKYLRLDRPLQTGMVVTIEPGFYQIPAILNNRHIRETFSDCVNWDRLADFADVQGIRIEDDIWVSESGAQVLTSALPTQADEILRCLA